MNQVKSNCITVLSRLCVQQKSTARKNVKNKMIQRGAVMVPSFLLFQPTKNATIQSNYKLNSMKSYQQSYAKKIFDDEFYLFLAPLINLCILYARQNNRHRFTCCLSEIKSFLGVLMFSGYHKLPQEEMYLCLDPDCSTSVVRDALTRQRHKKIKRNIHLSNNANLNIDDKLFKVRPYMNLLKKYICSLVYSNLICPLMSK